MSERTIDHTGRDVLPEHHEFECPKCGGHHFGSVTETRPDGSIWKTHEVCHDEHRIACNHKVERLVRLSPLHPLPGEWWVHRGDISSLKLFIVGRNSAGEIVVENFEQSLLAIGFDAFANWHHEPLCTGWDWRPEADGGDTCGN